MFVQKPIVKAVLAASLTLSAVNTYAQLEEVIVTATKREASVQDIPVTVTALSETAIRESGINNLEDVAMQVPALSVTSNQAFSARIAIRGIGTAQNDPSLEASVAFILDGIYMGRSGLGLNDLTDVERIEVLQGPQGTLYGKNSSAGVISVVTKQPNTEEVEGYVEATAGDYDLQKYVGAVSGPITDSLAYRVSGQWREQDGWLESGTGDDLNAIEAWNAQGKIQWLASEELSFSLSGAHVDRDDSIGATDAKQTDSVINELINQGLPVPKNDAFDYKNNVNVDSAFELQSDTLSLNIDYDLDSATITSLSSWNDYDYSVVYDADASQLDVLQIVNDHRTGEFWSQEFRLTSELDGPLQYLAGVYYAYEELTRKDGGGGFIQIGDDMLPVASAELGPALLAAVQPGDNVFLNNTWETETFAVFGQSTYTFAEDWDLTAGLRYTTETKDADLFTETFSTSLLAPTGNSLVQRAFGDIDESFNREKDGFTGLLSLSYEVSADVMLFTSVSTGGKSGGFNGVAAPGVKNEFDDEESTNYELGLKSQWFENNLQVNATAFFTDFSELQYLAQQPTGVGTFVDNGDAETQGVEVSFAATPWPFLNISGGVQYLDAEYTSGQLDDQGLDLPFAPDWTGNLAATLMLPLGDGITYLRGDYSYMGDHFNNAGYQPDSTEQEKEIVNARLGWRNDSWDAALWVKNATDEEYSALSGAPIVYTGARAEWLEAPRTYGATVRYSF